MARLNLSIPDELNNALAISAKSLDRSRAYIARKAIESYLRERQEDIEDYKDALEDIRDNSPRISWEQVQKENQLI